MIITAKDGQLNIQLQGWEKVWALKSRIAVPRSVISSIKFIDEKSQKNISWPFFKFPGTDLPGVLMAGTFVKPGERDFWYLRVQHKGILDIRTHPGSFKYNKILLSCDTEVGKQIISWWK